MGYCCHWYSLPWLIIKPRASRVRFTLLLSFSEKCLRPVLSLKQLTLKQWLAYPDQKPCLCCLLLCLYITNTTGVQNANHRGGQGTADECQSCLWVWEEKAVMLMTEAAVGCRASVSGTLHKLHFVSHSLRAPANSVKHRICWGQVSDGLLLFCDYLFFLEKKVIIFLCKAVKIRNRWGGWKVTIEVKNKIYVNWYLLFNCVVILWYKVVPGVQKWRCPSCIG